MKRKLAFTLVLALLLGVVAASTAEFGEIVPMYDHTSLISASLSISGGVATCQGLVRPLSNQGKASIVVRLQRKNSTGWTTIDSWNGTASGFGRTALAEGTKAVSSGYTYRVAAIGTIRDSAGAVLETTSDYSSEISY